MNVLVVDECLGLIDMLSAFFKENNDVVFVSNFEKASQTFKEKYDSIDFIVINADPRRYKEIIDFCSEIKFANPRKYKGIIDFCSEIKSTNQDQTVFVMADCYDDEILLLKHIGCHISIFPNIYDDLEMLIQNKKIIV